MTFTQDFRIELAQIRSELHEKVVDDVEDFEIYANVDESICPDNICGRLLKWELPSSVVFGQLFTWFLKEKHCIFFFTRKTSVISPVPKKLINEILLLYGITVRLLWYLSPLSVLNVSSLTNSWNTRSPISTHTSSHTSIIKTLKTQHSFAQCIYSSWNSRLICSNSLHRLFFCLQYHATTPDGIQTSETRR